MFVQRWNLCIRMDPFNLHEIRYVRIHCCLIIYSLIDDNNNNNNSYHQMGSFISIESRTVSKWKWNTYEFIDEMGLFV